MIGSLIAFRKANNENLDLQEKIKAGADLVELGKENGCDFEEHNLKTFFEELIHEDVITDFEDELCDMYCEKYGV